MSKFVVIVGGGNPSVDVQNMQDFINGTDNLLIRAEVELKRIGALLKNNERNHNLSGQQVEKLVKDRGDWNNVIKSNAGMIKDEIEELPFKGCQVLTKIRQGE